LCCTVLCYCPAPHHVVGTHVAGLQVQLADDFSFTDSVDGSVSSKQGTWLSVHNSLAEARG
jgi:hypothetical protein